MLRSFVVASTLLYAVACWCEAAVWADVPQQAEVPETAGPTPQEIATWIEGLSSNDFAVRKAASQQLCESANADVVTALLETAKQPAAEAGMRSLLAVQKIMREAPEQQVRDAAKAGLQQLADSELPVARLAKRMLETPAALPTAAQNVGMRVKVSMTNDHRVIEINEPGREVRFEDVGGKNIKVEVTTTANGQKQTDKHEAADLADLKQKQPALAQLFERYSQPVAQFGFPPPFPPAFAPAPLPVPFNPPLQNRANAKAHASLAAALEQLKQVQEKLSSAEEVTAAQRDELKQQLETLCKELHAAQEALE